MRRRIMLSNSGGGSGQGPSVAGVYAAFKDGSFSTATSYTTAQKANIIGVCVVAAYPNTELHKFVIDKTDVSTSGVYYGGYNKDLSGIGVLVTTDSSAAKKDMDGKGNTEKIAAVLSGYNDGYRTGSAAKDCQARFDGQGHLMSLGEWQMAYNYKDAINTMMTAIGGTALKSSYYWSSTLYNASTFSWLLGWSDGNVTNFSRGNYRFFVRAALQLY